MAEVELDLGEEERRQLVEVALRAIKEEEPAAKAALMHQLIRLIGDEPDRAVQGILRDAGVFGVARDVITGLTGLNGLTGLTGLSPTLDTLDEDETDALETACSLVRAATEDNQESQAAASEAGLGSILVDLEQRAPTLYIRTAAGAALIAMDMPLDLPQ
jgi:hypothetical protein